MLNLRKVWERLLPSNSPDAPGDRATTRDTGLHHEQMASGYLRNQGFVIRATNYRTRSGEIDIVALDEMTLVFVEVRFRSHPATLAEYTVDRTKQRKLWKTAAHYLRQHPWDGDVRFDVIAINGAALEHYQDAFRGNE